MVELEFRGDQARREGRALRRGDRLSVSEKEAEDLIASGHFKRVEPLPPAKREVKSDLSPNL